MTSMAAESATTILCTAKQTRFHIDSPNYRELDVQGLHILVTSGEQASSTAKAKSKRSDGLEILSNAKLLLKEGQRYALVGRNGTGKSTLLRAIADKLIPGIPEGTRIAILQQTKLTDDDGDENSRQARKAEASVLQEVIDQATARDTIEQEIKALSDGVDASDPFGPVRALRSLKHHRLQKRLFRMDKEARLRSGARGMQARKALVAFEKVVADSDVMINQSSDEISPETLQSETQEAADMLAELQIQVEPSRIAQIETRARTILTGLGFTEERMGKPISSMSGGWHMRAALATALLQDADILILDEPTNFLDLLGIVWLQRHLQHLAEGDRPPTVIMVSHDRDFISVCTDLMILKEKQLTYFHGDLPTYEASQAERKLWLKKMKAAQAKQRAHMEKTIAQNIKAGKANDDQNKIRQAKSRQKKLDDRMGLQVSAKGHRFKLNRDMVGYFHTAREDIDVPPEERPVVIALPEPPDLRFPGSLLSLDNASYRYGPRLPLVVDGASLTVGMGDRIGILGLNGCGKTTLVKMLVDEARPTAGSVTAHPRLKLGYYSQHAVEAIKAVGRADPALTALGLLAREVDGQMGEGEIRGLLGELGLPGRIASDTPLCKLSGGQLVRCELARLFWRRPHCLVLDEVTTHLDYETVTALRVALDGWDGAVVLVSHDRWFVRGVVEGNLDDEGDDGEQSDEEGEAAPRRRIVYRLKGGSMTPLEGGVEEFEKSMEKRVNKLTVQ
ncbi:putative ABC ATPase [Metarhizium anisopliae]